MNNALEDGTPGDWLNPYWQSTQKAHNWKNHVSDEVKAIWNSFTDGQKQALARQAQFLADNEEWE